MKSVLQGLLAAIIGCAIFFACLVAWYELTGQGSGVFSRREAGADDAGAAVTVVVRDTSAGDTPQSSSAAGNAAVTGTEDASDSPLVLIPTEEAANVNRSAEQETLLDRYVSTIERELSASLDSHVRVSRSPRGITITLWEDDLIARLTAGQANGDTAKIWSEKNTLLKDITTDYFNRCTVDGITDARIIANLLNEQRMDDIILSYEDGTLVHDGLDHE